MKTTHILIAATVTVLAAGSPAAAQMQNGAMSNGAMAASDHGMMAGHRMSAADRRMMTRCQAMSHDAMMRNRSCKRMMQMHPDMMQGH